ncbi:hypothetical protein [Halostagnicola sp. A56]|uniref:hypothetical protein n=1 Tax=Halostagnicola sp. A56 TaxID=1495067 RepID=UPI0012E2BACD|nr:hypothetical protein [Halostagnicola sp. A56]
MDELVRDGFAYELNNIQVRQRSEEQLKRIASESIAEEANAAVPAAAVDVDERTDFQPSFRLPESIVDQLPGRGMGEEFGEALVGWYTSPYTSVVNRIDVKQEILNYILHGEEPSKDVSRTICTGYESQRLYNLPDFGNTAYQL